MAFNLELFKQITRFVIIGTCAAAVNLIIVITLVELKGFTPLAANVIAFMVAFQVSYFGNRFWTFQDAMVFHHIAMPKLFVISIMNFITNEGLFYFFLTVVGLPYIMALITVLAILPAITFTFNKFWVFR